MIYKIRKIKRKLINGMKTYSPREQIRNKIQYHEVESRISILHLIFYLFWASVSIRLIINLSETPWSWFKNFNEFFVLMKNKMQKIDILYINSALSSFPFFSVGIHWVWNNGKIWKNTTIKTLFKELDILDEAFDYFKNDNFNLQNVIRINKLRFLALLNPETLSEKMYFYRKCNYILNLVAFVLCEYIEIYVIN